MADIAGTLVLAQNQHALIQDNTKGTVQVYAGPHALALSNNDRPVIYNKDKDEFVTVTLPEAIKQNPSVPEGHYLILENPTPEDSNGGIKTPKGGANSPIDLQVGRKINIPGPTSFPLWPGQFAQAVPGHHLRSNQYLIVRVYNADQANANRPDFLSIPADKKLNNGHLLIIKGTDVPFFIPPTGFEVLKENNIYVREALTLERLEYCILLDEDGNKRYERGPKVVFPEATENFISKNENDATGQRSASRKFKAVDLNDQMGLFIKIVADYTDEETGKEYTAGNEIFITGKEQRIYYQRPEHSIIEYYDPTKGFNRQKYYGITIPKGEARYVLDKVAGEIQTVVGPKIFLPNPVHQVIVRRILDTKTVKLWYPSNIEALTFNESLRGLADSSTSYLTDNVVTAAAADISRNINRGTKGSTLLGASETLAGDKISRSGKFTPPPMLTLSTKYDGVPSINIWTGYAVQVVNKSGGRRIVIGPATVLLDYDESLEVLELSTGNPKNTDTLHRDVYLRVDNNLVSDTIRIETKDLVNVDVKVSYRVNFLREHQEKWFNVENYVKFLCDHLRSHLKAKGKSVSVKEIIENSAKLIRDVVLGEKTTDNTKRSRLFTENGMEVYDVEVLSVNIADEKISNLLKNAQQKAVESTIALAANEQTLEATRRQVEINSEIAELETKLRLRKEELARQENESKAETTMAALQTEIDTMVVRMNADIDRQEQKKAIAQSEFELIKLTEDYNLELETSRVKFFETKMKAITPDLVAAMQALGNTEMASKLMATIAPLAIAEQTGLVTTLEKVFAGTPMANIFDNLQHNNTVKK